MRKYLYLARTSFLEIFEYKANLPAKSFAFIVNLSLTLILWLAVTGNKSEIFSYTRSDLILYYLFMAGILPLVMGGGDVAQKIGNDIKTGDLGGILLKPVRPSYYYGSISIAERLKDFVTVAPIVFVVWLAAGFSKSITPDNILLIIVSLFFTFILNHLFMALVGLVAFWTTEISWTSTFVAQVVNLVSGVRFPTNFYPAAIVSLIGLTPFLYFGFFPASIFLQKETINLLFAFSVQLFWVIALLIVLKHYWLKGLKIYEGAAQ